MAEVPVLDTLTKLEIERALGLLLPRCKVDCLLSADGTASLMVGGEHGEAFAVFGVVRRDYHGPAGLKRLASQIFEDIELARQGLLPLGSQPNQVDTE